MNEQQFHSEVDKLFLKIEEWLEEKDDAIDFESHTGILTITLPKGSQLVLSRQATLQEIWLASTFGAFHFHQINADWVTREGQELWATLSQSILSLTRNQPC